MADPATEREQAASLDPLLERIDLFTAFIRRRTGDGELAAEVVQESLAKAVATAGSLRDSQRIVPWFWQIVRNTLPTPCRADGDRNRCGNSRTPRPWRAG
jgi:DNA-directed RNA polymerase specialized sigma24 family protein